jgi:FKBP-type peptidyl-prolyl cis-trans isomerase FklB
MTTRNCIIVTLIAFLTAGVLLAADESLKDMKDKRSYCIGLDIGQNLKDGMFELNIDHLLNGIRDSYAGNDWKVTQDEMVQILTEFQQELQQKQMEIQQKAAAENMAAGKAFLDENAKKEGIKVTETGLQYKEVEPGTGSKPSATDKVKVHYHGTLIDGTVFDSSIDRGEPVVFAVNQVIPGWSEAIQLMSEGAKYQVFIPSELAYGANGAGQAIGPNAALIFDIELIKINPEE